MKRGRRIETPKGYVWVADDQMTIDDELEGRPARARSTDPDTSHEAAEKVEVARHRKIVVLLLGTYGRMIDELLVDQARREFPNVSPSSIRSRRVELERDGYVEPVGESTTRGGNRAIVHDLTDYGRERFERLRSGR